MKCSTRVVTLALLSCAALICAPSAHAAESTNQYLQFTNPSDASIPYSGGAVAVSVKNGTLLRNCLVRTTVHLEGFPCSSSRLNTMWIPASNSPNATTVKITLTGKRGAKNVMENLDLTVSGMPRDLYVALGDSFSSGEGNVENGWLNNNGTSDWTGVAFPLEIPKAGTRVQRATTTGCNRSSVSFPFVTYQALKVSNPDLGFADYACSGATSTDLTLDSQAVSAGASKASGNHDEPRQLENESALRAAKYVSLTIGGNDLGFADVIKECVLLLFCAKKSGNNFTNSALAKAMKLTKDMGPILDATYTKLKTVAPTAKVFVLDYPNLLPTKPNSSCGFFWKDEVTALQQLQSQLHASVKKSVAKAGFIYVDPNTNSSTDPLKNTSFEGHSICESADKRWFHEVSVANVATTGNSGRTAHPNPMGQRAMADALLAAIQLDQLSPRNLMKGRLSAGPYSTCVVTDDSGVKCWGGYAEYTGSNTLPEEVPGITDALAVSVSMGANGRPYQCALMKVGRVKCWGDNSFGVLGRGFANVSGTPDYVPDVSGAVAISTGIYHACALLKGGLVMCWGNLFPDGFAHSVEMPVKLTKIASGRGQTCGVSTDSQLVCWGYRYVPAGVLPTWDGPHIVQGVDDVAEVVVGDYHTCLLLNTGMVECFGFASFLSPLYSPEPTSIVNENLSIYSIPLNRQAVAISAGYNHDCALLVDSRMQCWGDNYYGQLGNFSSGFLTQPVFVVSPYSDYVSQPPLTKVVAITAGGTHSCAVVDSGSLYCWGRRMEGQLGVGREGEGSVGVSKPTLVPDIRLTTSPANR